MIDQALGMLRQQGPCIAKEAMAGPFPRSNWVLPGVICIGPAPHSGGSDGHHPSRATLADLQTLVDIGIKKFVDMRGRSLATAQPYLDQVDLADVGDDVEYIVYEGSHIGTGGTYSETGIDKVNGFANFLRTLVADALESEQPVYLHGEDGMSSEIVAACGIVACVYGASGLRACSIVSAQFACRDDDQAVTTLIPQSMRPFIKEVCIVCSAPSPILTSSQQQQQQMQQQKQQQQRSRPSSNQNSPSRAASAGDTAAQPLTAMASANAIAAMNSGGDPAASFNHNDVGQTQLAGQYLQPQQQSSARPGTGNFGRRGRASGGGSSSISIIGSEVEAHGGVMSTSSAESTPHRTGRAGVHTSPTNQGNHAAASVQMPPDHQHQYQYQQQQQQQQQQPPQHHNQHQPQYWGTNSFNSTNSGGGGGGGASNNNSANNSVNNSGTGAGLGLAQDASAGGFSAPPPVVASTTVYNSAANAAFSGSGSGSGNGSGNGNDAHRYSSLSLMSNGPASPNAAGGAAVFPPMLDPNSPADLPYIRGPVPTSNWVIRGRVCAGSVPNVCQPRFIEALGKERFAFLVNLKERDLDAATIDEMAAAAGGMRPQVLHFPLPDGAAFQSAQHAREFLTFARRIIVTLEQEPLARAYVFCHGGHGRTGMFVACILALVYGLAGMRAVNLCDRLHDLRVNNEGQSSPQTHEQRTAVISLLKKQ